MKESLQMDMYLNMQIKREVVSMPNIIKPQPRQEQFLSSIADIVIFGG